jgi:acetyl-CoA acetyltransferase
MRVSDAYIAAALRTPVGKHGGALAGVRADDLAAIPIRAVVERSGIDPRSIDDVILGCTNQAGEDNRNVARMALLLAGLPVEVPGQTVNRLCGSGMQATISAAREIQVGGAEVMVAGGVESIGRLLFTDYLFPFELTSVLLLAAMVGVLLLARRHA